MLQYYHMPHVQIWGTGTINNAATTNGDVAEDTEKDDETDSIETLCYNGASSALNHVTNVFEYVNTKRISLASVKYTYTHSTASTQQASKEIRSSI